MFAHEKMGISRHIFRESPLHLYVLLELGVIHQNHVYY